MPVAAGERIGPFQIVAPIGKGGMGEIYRARDTRLNRDVAVKLLPEGVNDDDSLRRFERETRAIAALNHPNILAIHDTGMHRDVPYAVTELLQGETLAERLHSGPLAPPRATEIASQIAEGLGAAHAMGVIHRDIKPENIFLTNDGRAKILDFGIARIENPALGGGRVTQPSGVTSSSVFVMGTAGYISPEQVRGKRADARSDIFALGAVYFEMLTGQRAFLRNTAVETLGAVLRDDPRKHPEVKKVPESLRGFVFRCLEKDPADRYQSARDLLMDLRAWQAGAVKEAGSRIQFQSVAPWRQRKPRMILRAVAGVLLLLVGFYAGSCWQKERQAMRINPPAASSR